MIQPKDILLVSCLCGAEQLVLLELCKMRLPCHHAESFRGMSSLSLVWEATPIMKMHILDYESLQLRLRFQVGHQNLHFQQGPRVILRRQFRSFNLRNTALGLPSISFAIMYLCGNFFPRPNSNIYVVLSKNVQKWPRNSHVFRKNSLLLQQKELWSTMTIAITNASKRNSKLQALFLPLIHSEPQDLMCNSTPYELYKRLLSSGNNQDALI